MSGTNIIHMALVSPFVSARSPHRYCSRDRMRINEEEGKLARLTIREGVNENAVAAVKDMPFPLMRREFVLVQVCASDDDSDDLLFAAESVDESVDYGANYKVVRGTARTFVRLQTVSPDACRLTAFQIVDAGGWVPAWVLNRKVAVALGGMEEIRDVFDRSDEVDKVARDELANVIEHEQQVYDEGEEAFITDVQKKLGGLKEEDFKELDSPDHLVKMHSIFKEKNSSAVGRASTVRPFHPPPPSIPPTY
jgi:hypothetical protein